LIGGHPPRAECALGDQIQGTTPKLRRVSSGHYADSPRGDHRLNSGVRENGSGSRTAISRKGDPARWRGARGAGSATTGRHARPMSQFFLNRKLSDMADLTATELAERLGVTRQH